MNPGRVANTGSKAAAAMLMLSVWTIPVAHAEPPSASVLATIDATLAFCAESDTKRAVEYRERASGLTKLGSAQEISEVRGSDAYRDAYKTTHAALAQTSPEEALTACRSFLDGRN